MKGLLLKDFYMVIKYYKMYLLILIAFIIGSIGSDDNFFFAFYPCLISGMIPVNLLAYDERSRWNQYCQTLPYTKTQIVSGKYLMGLFVQIAVIILSALAQAVRMNIKGVFDIKSYLMIITMLLILSFFSSSISLPFMFKLGVEKGRTAYFVMIGVICGGSVVASNLLKNIRAIKLSIIGLLSIFCIAAVSIYALSWYLSVVFYKKREV